MKELLSILKHELRDIVSSPLGLVCLALHSIVLGAGFYLAMSSGPEAAGPGAQILTPAGITGPVRSVFTPAFTGAYYLFTHMLPLIVARTLYRDNGGGALMYLGQICGMGKLFIAKSISAAVFLVAGLIVSIPAVLYWMMLGGGVPLAGLALLYAGFLLPCMLASALAFAASSVTRSYTAASCMAVLVMAILFDLDCIAGATGSAPGWLVPSLRSMLIRLGDGGLSTTSVVLICSASLLLGLLSYCMYSRGRQGQTRTYIMTGVIAAAIGCCIAIAVTAGVLDRTIRVDGQRVSGAALLCEEALKAAGLFPQPGPVTEALNGAGAGQGLPGITIRDRQDILVLYWAVIPLLLLCVGSVRAIGTSRLPEGRKRIITTAGTWLVVMASLALMQDYYLKNRTWKVLPSVREVLPRWVGGIEDIIRPKTGGQQKQAAAGAGRYGPPDPNCLYAGKDHEYLRRFFKKLSDLKENRRDTVRIVHYGDSLIWGDCYTKTMKREFQKEFGDGGRGIVPPVETMATALEDHVNRTFAGEFTQHAIRHEFRYMGRFFKKPDINPMVGFTGEGAFIRGPGSEIRMEAPAGSGKISRVTMYLRSPKGSAPVNEYRVNLDYGTGKAVKVVSLGPDSTGHVEFKIPPSDRIAVNFLGSTGASCSVDAVNLETGRGIAYSTIVRMGIHMAWMNAIPVPYLEPLRHVSPDLLVFQFGINEAASLGGYREFTKDELRRQMREWLGTIKRLLPETDVLLIGPPERLRTFQAGPAPMKETFDVQEVQREEAHRAGFAYYDTYQCLGGEGQMMKMASTGLAMSDFTHFTMRGGSRAAEGFYTSLMNVYHKKSDRPKLDLTLKESRAIRFNSASYAYFLALVVLTGLALRGKQTARLVCITGASYFFYSTWMMWPLACLAATTTMDYFMARLIKRARDNGGKGTGYLVSSLVFNLGLLFALKYFDFFSDLAGKAIHALGYQASVPILNILLPAGISFYTFQSLSYTIDVWRGRVEPETSFIRYAQYVSMFTQLLAGPIVKAREYLPALKDRAVHFIATHEHFTAALFLIFTGLVKKTGADWLAATIVDRVYESPQMFLPLETLTAVYAYGIQIYGDFSGYTDMAIGSAMLLGFRLTENFRRPYISVSLSEFWQRWHMSLGSWLGDYLYISMGGNRRRVLFNIGFTMFICGLWHGAGIPFLLWGLYHGFFMVMERMFGWNKKETRNRFLRGLRVFVTLHIVLFGWIIFRSGSWETFTGVIGSLSRIRGGAPNVGPLLLAVMGGFYALHYTPVAWKERLKAAWASMPATAQGIAASIITIFLYNAATAGIKPFIYFQF